MIRHKLPGDAGNADDAWFTKRQNAFEQAAILQQVAFKRRRWPELPDGAFSKQPEHTYPHILPSGWKQLAFYEGFAEQILKYLDEEDIAAHSELLNLKSSQAACFNFLFPLRLEPALAPAVLRDICPGISRLESLHFEYTGQDQGSTVCTDWLGEPAAGKRGQNRTSIDAAIRWIDAEGRHWCSLVEWKYTEHSFGSCSAFQNGDSERRARCRSLDVLAEPDRRCELAGPGRHRGRRYWDRMAAAGIDTTRLSAVAGCPFQGPFYQLMRQFLVAGFLRESEPDVQVEVVSLDFSGNTALKTVPAHLEPLCGDADDTVVDAWNVAVSGAPALRHVTAEQLMAGYDACAGTDPDWRGYIRERYRI